MSKKNKQEVKDANFSFGVSNISKADDLINKKDFSNKDEKVVLLFRVGQDVHSRFNFLKNERAIRQKNYREYNRDTFQVMIKIVEKVLKEKGIYEEATELFKHLVNKTGKRQKNKRTVSKDEVREMQIVIPYKEGEIYMNCFYSFIKNSPNEDVNDTSLSKNYFFYDVIDIISENKNEFFKYKLDEK